MKKFYTIGMLLFVGIALSGVFLEKANAQSWFASGSRPQDYEMGGDPMASHGSENAGFIRSKVKPANGFGTWMTTITSGAYLGKGIKLTAYVKTTNVKNWVGLWLRIDDAANQTLSLHNMHNRPIRFTTDWQEYEIVVDVPENSTQIAFGIILDGTGEAWVDGLKFEAVERSWVDQNSGINEYILSIKAVDENTVWAGAGKGNYLRTTDGGSNWISGTIPGAESMNFCSIAVIDQNTAYFLGQGWPEGSGRIYKTSDGGASWTLQYQNTSPGVYFVSIAFWDETHGIAISNPVNGSFLIITTTDGGNNWNQVPATNIPEPLPGEWAGTGIEGGTQLAVDGTKNAWFGTGFLAANGLQLRVLRSTDQGQHWAAANTPLYRGSLSRIMTIAFKDSLNGFVGSASILPDSGVTNSLAQTSDGGKSWTLVPSFQPFNPSTLVYVPHTNSSVLFVTSEEGSGYSDDGGTTWKCINHTDTYAMSFASPTAGWAAGRSAGRIVKFAGHLPTDVFARQQENKPKGFELLQNHPNPFNPNTTITYSIPQSGFVELKIYNILGRKIQTLVSEFQQAGNYNFDFNASDLSNDVYFYQLKVGESYSETKKMLYVK